VAQLREAYDETLDALRCRFEQLEAAVAQFPPDLDERTLTTAWGSDDPSERNRADGVLASFEKTYMLLMDLITLSVKLGRRVGDLHADEDASAVEVLRDAGVISHDAQEALEVQREVRNTSQHVYVELSMSVLRDAVQQQLEMTPRAIRNIAVWVESLEQASEPMDHDGVLATEGSGWAGDLAEIRSADESPAFGPRNADKS
jgi:uncharacterized protein YutE (UPF0331/DUF86 family)